MLFAYYIRIIYLSARIKIKAISWIVKTFIYYLLDRINTIIFQCFWLSRREQLREKKFLRKVNKFRWQKTIELWLRAKRSLRSKFLYTDASWHPATNSYSTFHEGLVWRLSFYLEPLYGGSRFYFSGSPLTCPQGNRIRMIRRKVSALL